MDSRRYGTIYGIYHIPILKSLTSLPIPTHNSLMVYVCYLPTYNTVHILGIVDNCRHRVDGYCTIQEMIVSTCSSEYGWYACEVWFSLSNSHE